MRFFRRKTRVLVPFLVEETRSDHPADCTRPVWIVSINLSKSGLRPLTWFKRISERVPRPLAFDGDASDVTCAFYKREVFFSGNSRLMGIKRESAQHLVSFVRIGSDRARIPCDRKIAYCSAVLLRGDIGDNHPFLQKCRVA